MGLTVHVRGFKQDRDFLDKASVAQEFITRSVAQLFPPGGV